MKNVDLEKIKIGHTVLFRNGGKCKIRQIENIDSDNYPIGLRFNNFNASNTTAWSYNKNGMCGEQKGKGHMCPFDIMKVIK